MDKFIAVIVSVAVVLCVVFTIWVGYFFYSMGDMCSNEVLETVVSPDASRKVVIFLRNCGATTDWSVHASITKAELRNDQLSMGNSLVISADGEKTWPVTQQGWPLIKAKWESENVLELYHSSEIEIYTQVAEVDNVSIEYNVINQEFVEKENLEIR